LKQLGEKSCNKFQCEFQRYENYALLEGDEKSSVGCKWDEGIEIYMEILNLILLL